MIMPCHVVLELFVLINYRNARTTSYASSIRVMSPALGNIDIVYHIKGISRQLTSR